MTKNIVAEIGRLLIEYEIEKQRKQKTASRPGETALDDRTIENLDATNDKNSKKCAPVCS